MQDTSCYHLCYCIPRVASLLAALSSVLSSFNSCSSMLVTILGSSSDLRLTSIWDCSAIWDHRAFHSWPHRHRPPRAYLHRLHFHSQCHQQAGLHPSKRGLHTRRCHLLRHCLLQDLYPQTLSTLQGLSTFSTPAGFLQKLLTGS